MKITKNIFILLLMLFLFGCNPNNGESLTVTKGKTYYDKNNMYNGASLSRIELKNDSTVLSTTCGKEAGCSIYKGTYEIDGDLLKITLTSYQEMTGEWVKLEDKYVENISYKITDNNIFEFTPDGGDKQVFVME